MVEVRRGIQRAARAGDRVALRLVTDVLHPANVRRHRGALPPLDDVGREVVATLARGDIATVHLDDLGLASTRDMERAGRNVLAELEEEHRRDLGTEGVPRIRTATRSAALRAWATESSLVAIAQHHIELPIVFQGVHARLEQANAVPRTTELWHRDVEDRRMLKCFVHFSEVTNDHGPFEYLRDADVTPATIRRIAARRAGSEPERRTWPPGRADGGARGPRHMALVTGAGADRRLRRHRQHVPPRSPTHRAPSRLVLRLHVGLPPAS